jgi:hypothetical protein
MIATTTGAAALVDRSCFDGFLGLATSSGTMLPAAMTFATITGWFAGTGLRAIAHDSPIFRAIARGEDFVDDDAPTSEEDVPPSTRRLLERVRAAGDDGGTAA